MSKDNKKENFTKSKTLMVGLISVMIVVLVALLGYVIFTKVSAYQEKKKTMQEFHETMESKELSVIYYMHTGCQFCEMEEPILEQIAKDYNFEYLKIDSSNLTKKEDTEIKDTLKIEGRTPTIVIVKDGEVQATHVGYLEGHKLVEFFIKAEVLDENSTYKPEENLTFIDFSDFEELKDEEKKSVLVLGSATCDYCKAVRPILSNLSKAYNIPIYYLGLNYIGSGNGETFESYLKEMGYDEETFVNSGKYSTPAVLIIRNGKIVSHIEGYQDMSDYIKYFKEQKVIEE